MMNAVIPCISREINSHCLTVYRVFYLLLQMLKVWQHTEGAQVNDKKLFHTKGMG